MDFIRNVLTAVKDLLAWLPDPAVAVIILVVAAAIAFALHQTVRRLLRAALAQAIPLRVLGAHADARRDPARPC